MKSKVKYIILSLVITVLMLIATFYDLEINKKLYNPDSSWALIFEVIGEFPIYFGLLFFGVTFFHVSEKKFYKHLLLIEIFFATFISIMMPSRYLFDFSFVTMGIILLISVITWFVIMKLSYKVSSETYTNIKGIALAYGIGIITQLIVVYAIKLTWSRQRFFTLNENYDGFTPWYVINWFGGHTSFPSGHTSGAANILYLTLLPEKLDKSARCNVVVKSLCYAFIVLTGFSRIILGRHYLSDVVMAFVITYVIHKIVTKSIKDRQKKVKSI